MTAGRSVPLLTDAELTEALMDQASLTYLSDRECRWALAYVLGLIDQGGQDAPVLRRSLGKAVRAELVTRPDGFAGRELAERMRRVAGVGR